MRRITMIAGALGLMALAMTGPAKADAWVDTPSFGRIVYGITGGEVILPADAWLGYYPDNTANTALPNDGTFSSGANSHYVGDMAGTPNASWSDVGTTLTVNATQVGNLTSNLAFTNGNSALWPRDQILAIKLAYVSSEGTSAEVSVKDNEGSTVLFGAGSAAGTTGFAVANDPFSLLYKSVGAVANPFSFQSDDLSANGGSAANKLYNHFKAYQYNTGSQMLYFVGMEDWNYDTSGTGHKRWDWNDTVMVMSLKAVPEPAFYQMASLLSLGGLGLLRLRRRA